MRHALSKTIIFASVVEMIAKKDHISLHEARDRFYNSDLIKLFNDDSLGLYGESPLFIYSLFNEELARKALK